MRSVEFLENVIGVTGLIGDAAELWESHVVTVPWNVPLEVSILDRMRLIICCHLIRGVLHGQIWFKHFSILGLNHLPQIHQWTSITHNRRLQEGGICMLFSHPQKRGTVLTSFHSFATS